MLASLLKATSASGPLHWAVLSAHHALLLDILIAHPFCPTGSLMQNQVQCYLIGEAFSETPYFK